MPGQAQDDTVNPGMFRWRTRVITGIPEFGGAEAETLASHLLNENAHPQYLKKGQVVPTGQEYTIVGRHNSYRLAHMNHLARRDELIRTKEEYDSAKNDAPYVDNANNYSKLAPKRHIMTARALGDVLAEYQRLDSIIRDCGDGTNLIYIDANGAGRVSDKNIGSATRPVYLKNGTVTACTDTVGSGTQPVYMNAGTITKSTSNVGAASQPVFLKNGTVTACTDTVGSGTQPVYMKDGVTTPSNDTVGGDKNPVFLKNGTVTKSSGTEGTTTKPVYLKDGVITAIPHDAVVVSGDQTINGRKTFGTVPNVTVDAADPSADTDLVTVAYLKKALQLPVGFHVITTRDFDTPAKVAAAMTYGTWKLASEVGYIGYMWLRTA